MNLNSHWLVEKSKLFDFVVYSFFGMLFVIDFFMTIDNEHSMAVYLSFFIIGATSFMLFVFDDGFLTIYKIIYVFMFLFCYYTPLHQYHSGFSIHNFGLFTSSEYLYANLLILCFIIIFQTFKNVKLSSKNLMNYNKESNFSITNLSALILSAISVTCLVFLWINNELISFSKADEIIANDSFTNVVLKILRFIPVSCLLIFIYTAKNKSFKCSKFYKNLFLLSILICCSIILFPLNGTLNRYFIFGAYIMIVGSLFEKTQYKSYIMIAAVIGFYYIFPAFNFFKYNGLNNISDFIFGGFSTNSIDYDSYHLFLQTIKYTNANGALLGKNILSALFCIVPRTIWKGKLVSSGVIISQSANASFTNVSCPLFAEFYLSFGFLGIVILTAVFARIVVMLEKGRMKDNILFKGIYFIFVGVMLPFMRGALLPTTSILYCFVISYIVVYTICKLFTRKAEYGKE